MSVFSNKKTPVGHAPGLNQRLYLPEMPTFEILKPSGPCGSIRLVKLVSKNPFSQHTRLSGYEMGPKRLKNMKKY